MLQEDKPWNVITKVAHVSCTQISLIKKNKMGEDGVQSSMRTQAYKMFFEGKQPIEVSIALEISEEVTTKFWEEYLKLTRHYKLLKIQDN